MESCLARQFRPYLAALHQTKMLKRAFLRQQFDELRYISVEVEEKAKYELLPSEEQVYEVTGEGCMLEAGHRAIQTEADRANLVGSAPELSVIANSEKGR